MKETASSPAALRQGIFNARDGTSIYYQVEGEGRPLIFCYGLVCRRDHWHHQISHFSKRYQVVTFDYRGHHASQKPDNDKNLTIDWCARDIEDLMAHLGLEESVCLGHSLGVPILTRASAFLGPRMRGAIFVCGSVSDPFRHMFFTDKMQSVYRFSSFFFEHLPQFASRVWTRFTDFNPLSFFLTSQLGFNPHVADEDDIRSYMQGVHSTPLPVFHRLLRDYTEFNGQEHLKAMQTPTLVIAGEEDYVTPLRVQKEMAELLPHGQLETIPEGSHNAHMDFPKEVNTRIESFLTQLGYV